MGPASQVCLAESKTDVSILALWCQRYRFFALNRYKEAWGSLEHLHGMLQHWEQSWPREDMFQEAKRFGS